jgi:small conductance mechanosensitive channel
MPTQSEILKFLVEAGLRVGLAALIFFVGRWLAGWSRRRVRPILVRANLSKSLVLLFTTLLYYGIWVATATAMLAAMGVPLSSAIYVAGIVLVILGIALQQTVRDLAAGVIFFLFKPFASGELIGTNAFIGTVEEIQLFNTVLIQGDNRVVILPNSQVQQNGITNYSRMGTLRVDLVFGIDYGDDLRKARQVLEEIMAADPRVLRDPAPQVIVLTLGDSSVNLGVRPWVKVQDYWNVQFDLTEQVKLRFDAEGIKIPFPQRDVHVYPTNGFTTTTPA